MLPSAVPLPAVVSIATFTAPGTAARHAAYAAALRRSPARRSSMKLPGCETTYGMPSASQRRSSATNAACDLLRSAGVGRGEVDEVRVVADDRAQAVGGQRVAEGAGRAVAQHRLAPLVRRLGEDLDRGGADGAAPRGRLGDAPLGRDVGAEEQVVHRSSAKA